MFKRAVPLFIFVFILLSSLSIPALAQNNRIDLPGTVADVAFDPVKSIVYVADAQNKLVIAIDYNTGIRKQVQLTVPPRRIRYINDELFVATSQANTTQCDAVMLFDPSTLALKDSITGMTLFDDAVVGNDGYIYTNAFTYTNSYSRQTKQKVQQYRSVFNGLLAPCYKSNNIYYSYSGFLVSLKYNSGNVLSHEFNMSASAGTKTIVSPDEKYVFTSNGRIFVAGDKAIGGLQSYYSLGQSFTDVCFDAQNDAFYTALPTKQIYAYDYKTLEGTATFESQGYVQYMNIRNGFITAVSKETSSGSNYFVETIDISAPQSTIGTTITTKPLEYENNHAAISAASVTKTMFNGDKVYIADSTGNAVYAIDTTNNTETKIAFPNSPNSLYYYNDELYVGFGNNGMLAILDTDSYAVVDKMIVGTKFTDMVVGNDGFIYTLGDSYARSFSRVTKQQISSINVSYEGNLTVSPTLNAIYFSSQGVSPGDIHTIKYYEGQLTLQYDSPYHGDYGIGYTVRVSPDGKLAFTSSGNVFNASDIKSEDMTFKCSLGQSFTDVCFDAQNGAFYTALSTKKIYAYDYKTLEGTATFESQGYVQYMNIRDGLITAVSKETSSGSNYFVETIDLSAPQSTIGTTITTNPLEYENGHAAISAASVTKAVFNGDKVYIADRTGNAVYAIDTTNNTETKIAFPNSPNSLYYYNGELYVGFGANGVLAILDAGTFEVKDKLILGTVFYDVAVGKDGYIYVIENFGSSAFSYARSFSRTTGQQLSSTSVYPRNGKFVPHPIFSMFYWADTGVSPQDINALSYENGVIKTSYDSPYHGNYSIGSRIRISPDGANIFTSGGNVFRSSDVQSEDMQYKNKFTSFADAAFDLSANEIYTAPLSSKNLKVYDYNTYESRGFIKTYAQVTDMAVSGGKIIAISKADSNYCVELIDKTEILQIEAESITVSITDTYFSAKNKTISLNPKVIFNDGTTLTSPTVVCNSSNPGVATVSASGSLQTLSRGYTEVSVKYGEITKTINVYVDTDVNVIQVEGYSIGFVSSKTSYNVLLPAGTVAIPTISVDADEAFDVEIKYPAQLPGTATITVGASGVLKKTYGIYFDVEKEKVSAVTSNVQSGEVDKGTTVILSTDTADAAVYYSINGSQYSIYNEPIIIDNDITIIAFAQKDGMIDSNYSTFTYNLKPSPTPTVTITEAPAERGSDVEISVNIKDNPGIAAFVFNIDYDASMLTPLAVNAGDVLCEGSFMSSLDNKENTAAPKDTTVSWVNQTNIKADGTLFSIVFHVNENTGGSFIPVSISYLDENVTNETYQNVVLTIYDGGIKLNNKPGDGDVFGDGLINAKDGLKLTQYFAGRNVVFTSEEWESADVNNDGAVDIKDGLRLAQFLAGWNVILGK